MCGCPAVWQLDEDRCCSRCLGGWHCCQDKEMAKRQERDACGIPEGAGDQLLVYSDLWFRACLWPSGFSVPGELSVFFQLL